jgi:hypothetical protein
MSRRSTADGASFSRSDASSHAVDHLHAAVAAGSGEVTREVDLNRLTPLEALNLLAELKKEI